MNINALRNWPNASFVSVVECNLFKSLTLGIIFLFWLATSTHTPTRKRLNQPFCPAPTRIKRKRRGKSPEQAFSNIINDNFIYFIYLVFITLK